MTAPAGPACPDQPEAASLGHFPAEKRWQFDDSVAGVFEDMLRRSVPDLDRLRDLCFAIGATFLEEEMRPTVVDLGCSRGEMLDRFYTAFRGRAYFLGVEISEAMLAVCRERFAEPIAAGALDIQPIDLRSGYPKARASLTLSFLTLQFTPIEHRTRILGEVADHTLPGGGFILVEKVIGGDAIADRALRRHHRAMKLASGYSEKEVDVKDRALEGELVPLTARFNEEILRGAGFRSVECFWRHLNFAAWLAVK